MAKLFACICIGLLVFVLTQVPTKKRNASYHVTILCELVYLAILLTVGVLAPTAVGVPGGRSPAVLFQCQLVSAPVEEPIVKSVLVRLWVAAAMDCYVKHKSYVSSVWLIEWYSYWGTLPSQTDRLIMGLGLGSSGNIGISVTESEFVELPAAIAEGPTLSSRRKRQSRCPQFDTHGEICQNIPG